MVASVFGTEDFTEACRAGGNVRGHQLILTFFGDAVTDFEAGVACGGMVGNGDFFYMSQRRCVIFKLGQEKLQVFAFPLDFDFDILGGIAHPAFQVVFGS